MKILSVGGGSGGHVTPVVAVLREIYAEHSRVEVRFWCDRHFAAEAKAIVVEHDPSIRVQTVWAGKFRRYSHLSKLQHILIPAILFPNIRDVLLVLGGFVQSLVRLLFWRPDVVFLKGGYVCLPVGLAARFLGVPIVVHDSDAHPGLTNRLLAPFASKIATGMPLAYYNYPAKKSVYVGTPIDSSFHKLTEERRKQVKHELGFDPARPLIVCVGGGQGSKTINDAVARQLPELLDLGNVLLVSGSAQYDELRSLTPVDDPRFQLKDFVSSGMPDILGSADIVVSRAGATFLLELAATARPTILIPSKRLKWQVKHAKHYADAGAVIQLDEDKFTESGDRSLVGAVEKIISSQKLQQELGENLHKHARPHAAKDTAALVIQTAKRR